MFDLTGKVVLTTGSSRGIGRAISMAMAAAGAKVVVSSRKKEACDAVAEAIRAGGGEALVVPCNISRKEELQNLVDGALRRFGRIDCLVCNAAVNPVYGPMATLPDEAFDKVMATNVRSSLWLANMVLPQMAARGDGSMIVVSSVAGMSGSATIGAYAISKAADFQLVRNLAVEWGKKNIRVNCIAPGLVKTDFARAIWEEPKALAAVESRTPLGRLGEPEDIAGIAVFLASRAGLFVTGQVIVADGGATIADLF